VVVDSLTQDTILDVLLNLSHGKNLSKTILLNSAKFSLNLDSTGKYKLQFTRIGFYSKTIELSIEDYKKNILLDTIKLTPKANQLAEVVINSPRSFISQKIDRIVYDVQADNYLKSLSVFDALKRVPYVSVMNNDIQVKGNNNVLILINGRRTVATDNPREFLNGLNASSVKSIEVITDPSAKYDLEGNGAVINIILNRAPLGYRGNTSMYIRDPEYLRLRSGLDLTLKKLSVSISIAPYKVSAPSSYSEFKASDGPKYELNQNMVNQYNSKNLLGSYEMVYQLDSLNTIAGDFSFTNGDYIHRSSLLSNLDQFSLESSSYLQRTTTHQNRRIHALNFNFQKSIRNTKGHKLNVLYYYGNSLNNQENNTLFDQLFNYNLSDFDWRNRMSSYEHSAQLDYTARIHKLSLETGIKTIYRSSGSLYSESDVNNPSITNIDFNANQRILTQFNNLSFPLLKYNFRIGLRIENSKINTDQLTSYFALLPNVLIQRPLKDGKQFKFSFSQSLSRPGISLLSPFAYSQNPNLTSTGNTQLEPIRFSKFNIDYSSFNQINWSVGLTYNYTKNDIVNITNVKDNNLITNRYENTGFKSNLQVSYYLGLTSLKKLRLGIDGSLSYLSIKGKNATNFLSNEGFYWINNISIGYEINKTLSIDSYLIFTTNEINLQNERLNGFVENTFGLSKTFLNRALTLNITAENPFMKFREFKSGIFSPLYTQYSFSYVQSRAYSVTLSYRYGKLKSQRRMNKKISNTDLIEVNQ
jgi:hypothetical protein